MAEKVDLGGLALNLGPASCVYFGKRISIPETQFHQLIQWGRYYQSDRVTLRT